jgi:hypothetical protein
MHLFFLFPEPADTAKRKDSTEAVNAKADEKNSSLMIRMLLNDHKAGMQGLDKARINQIIYENSKGLEKHPFTNLQNLFAVI